VGGLSDAGHCSIGIRHSPPFTTFLAFSLRSSILPDCLCCSFSFTHFIIPHTRSWLTSVVSVVLFFVSRSSYRFCVEINTLAFLYIIHLFNSATGTHAAPNATYRSRRTPSQKKLCLKPPSWLPTLQRSLPSLRLRLPRLGLSSRLTIHTATTRLIMPLTSNTRAPMAARSSHTISSP
jgi:hypothetical protein